MLGLRRALLALFALGVIFAGLDVALALTSSHEDQKVVTAILGPLIGLSFIGTGVFAWWRRPLNRFGLLMTGVGFAWFLAGLTESNNSTVFTIGSYVEPLYLVHRHPDGALVPDGAPGDLRPARDDRRRLPRRARRAPALLPARRRHLGRPQGPAARQRLRDRRRARPGRRLRLHRRPSSPSWCSSSTLVLLLRKRQAATPPQRRALAPMLWTGLALVGAAGHRLPHRRPRAAGRDRRRRRAPGADRLRRAALRLPGRPRAQPLLARRGRRRAHRAPQQPRGRPLARASRWPTRWATARSSSSTGARRRATTSPTTGARSSCPRRARAAR